MTNTEAATTADRIEDLESRQARYGGTAAQLREDLRAAAAVLASTGFGAIAIGHIADELTAAERAEADATPRTFRIWYRTDTTAGRTLRDIATVTAVDSLAAREAFEDEYPGAIVYGVDPA